MEKEGYYGSEGVYELNEEVYENDFILRISENLTRKGARYDVTVSGTVNGRDGGIIYYENLGRVIEAVYNTVAESNLALYKGDVYFFTGKIYERVPNKSFLERAVRIYLKRSGVPQMFIIKSFTMLMKNAYSSLEINRQLRPRFNIMAFENGVVDMEDGVLHDFSRNYHVTSIHKYRYDPHARCPKWLSFLRGTTFGRKDYGGGVLPDKNDRLILQMFLGLSLYDRGRMDNKIENALVLFGNGSNGKGVIMNTVTGILGEENISSLDMEALLRSGDERQRNLCQIEGKVFNWSGEIGPKTFAGREDAAKSLISGEPQMARKIGNNAFRITNIPYFIFNANRFPTAGDGSYGFFRRFIFLVFDKVVSDKDMNLALETELRSEYPGILNWIRNGAKLLKKNGFRFPESEGNLRKKISEMGLSALGKSWAMARGFYAYPREGVKGDIRHEVEFSAIYADIERYADDNGFPMVSKPTIAAHLRDMGFGKEKKRKVGGTVYYKCFGVTTDDLANTRPPVVADMEIGVNNKSFDYGEDYYD